MKYKLTSDITDELIKNAKELKEFTAKDLADTVKRSPSGISPYINKLKKSGHIKLIGVTYVPFKGSAKMQMRVYKAI